LNKQEGDGDFSQISSEENELDDELPSNMVSVGFFRSAVTNISCYCLYTVVLAVGMEVRSYKPAAHIVN